ncbi:MAG TPA: hypothetical protein VM123_01570 [archaeon]|nr:hypothetical protein [archaeon]
MDRCVYCIRPSSHKGISFNREGVCNFCVNYEKRWGGFLHDEEARAAIQASIRDVLWKKSKENKKYHVLVGMSGGKDSVFALHICREEHNLNVLTYTMDSPFLTAHARDNIQRAVNLYDVDHVWTQAPPLEMFRHFMLKTGKVCYPCNLSIMLPIRRLSHQHGINLVITGGSTLRDGLDPDGVTPGFFRNIMRESSDQDLRKIGDAWYRESVRTMASVLIGRPRLILLGSYFEGTEKDRSAMLEREFGFSFGHEHSDCELHDLASYCGLLKYGFTLKMSKYSKAILADTLDRAEALRLIEEENDYLRTFPDSIVVALDRLGVTKEQVKVVNTDHYYRDIMSKAVMWYRRRNYL